MPSGRHLFATLAGLCVLAFADTAAAVPGGAVDIDASAQHSCAVTDCGDLVCWGRNDFGQANDHVVTSGLFTRPRTPWTDVSTGALHTCAKDALGNAACWGYNAYEQTDLRIRTDVSQVAAGGYHTCVLDGWGAAYCNGYNGQGQASPPQEFFVDISAGAYHTCGLRTDGEILCWGDDSDGQSSPMPTWALRIGEEFVDVEAGQFHTCAVTDYGTLYCWGRGDTGQLHPAIDDGRWGPALGDRSVIDGDFESAGLGSAGTCAVSDDWVECWGYPFSLGGIYTRPSGFDYEGVAVGSQHACAFDTAGDVACWGHDAYGRATPDPITGGSCPSTPTFGGPLPFQPVGPWG